MTANGYVKNLQMPKYISRNLPKANFSKDLQHTGKFVYKQGIPTRYYKNKKNPTSPMFTIMQGSKGFTKNHIVPVYNGLHSGKFF